jgi:large subunit ribosomal protein L32e
MTEQHAKTTEKTLKLRKRMKKAKPKFVRPESWRYVRLKKNWRRPRGLDHKVRIKYDGWPPGVEVGYRGPRATRGLHPSGYEEVLVYNAEDLKKIDPKTQVARIAHTVGNRKRVKIIAEAKKKRIAILNVKTVKEAIPEVEKELTEEEKPEEKEKEKETEEVEKPKRKRGRTKKREGESEEQ